jgi:transposase
MAVVEVITSVQRRRRWSREEKLRIVAESAQPGRTASQVARDHGIARGQLFVWRRQLLAEAIATSVADNAFVPVTIANEPATETASEPAASSDERAIEIRLLNGIVIMVSNAIEVEPFRRVPDSNRCWIRIGGNVRAHHGGALGYPGEPEHGVEPEQEDLRQDRWPGGTDASKASIRTCIWTASS